MMSQIVISSETGLKGEANMISQVVISSQRKRKLTALPYAFTEHGVTMPPVS